MITLTRSFALVLIASLGINFTAVANDWRSEVDLARADLRAFDMDLINDGVHAGAMRYGWEQDGGHFVVRDRTTMHPNVEETAEGVIDAVTLLPVSVKINYSEGDRRFDFDIDWKNGRRLGSVVSHAPDRDDRTTAIDASATDATPLRLAVIGMVAALPLAKGYQLDMTWFNTMINANEDIRIEVTGQQEVETESGRLEAFKVELRGANPENIMYVSTALPRRIVRIDVVGQPMVFLRRG